MTFKKFVEVYSYLPEGLKSTLILAKEYYKNHMHSVPGIDVQIKSGDGGAYWDKSSAGQYIFVSSFPSSSLGMHMYIQ